MKPALISETILKELFFLLVGDVAMFRLPRILPLSSLIVFLFILGLNQSCASHSSRQIATNSPLKNPQSLANDFIYPWPYSKTLVGTAHAAPLYNPAGLLSEHILSQGALDARSMGYSVLKIWSGPEIFSPYFYRFPKSLLQSQLPLDQMLEYPEYKKVFQLPFDVFVIEFDTPELWAILSRPFTEADVQNIERQTYNVASNLLRLYAGSGKVFILQNHEADNHLADFGSDKNKFPNPHYVQPYPTAYSSYQKYFLARQAGIRRARKEAGAADVAIYQMCEVNAVVRSSRPDLMKADTAKAESLGQKLVTTSVTTEVLPHLDCDLYGYSAYDSIFEKDEKVLPSSLDFIRNHTAPSLAFGRNNIVISEFGIPEHDSYLQKNLPGFVQRSRHWIQDMKLPMLLYWQLYDNECMTGTCKSMADLHKNIESKQARGFWSRDVSGHYGAFFQGIRDLVEPQVSAEEVPRWTYLLLLGREANADEIKSGVSYIQAHGREAYYLLVSSSLEARRKLVTDVFEDVLDKSPNDKQLQFWSQFIDKIPLSMASNLLLLQGNDLDHIEKKPILPPDFDSSLSTAQKARKKLVLALYNKLLQRQPTDVEISSGLSSSATCSDFAGQLATGSEFQAKTKNLDNASFVRLLYTALLLRDGEPSGVAGWIGALDSFQMTRTDVAKSFASSDEMKGLCKSFYEMP